MIFFDTFKSDVVVPVCALLKRSGNNFHRCVSAQNGMSRPLDIDQVKHHL